MTADTAYKTLLYFVNKFEGGEPSPDEYRLIMQQGQLSYMSFLIGEYVQQQYQRPVSRVELGNNQHLYDTLSPFILDTTLTITSGSVAMPADYQAAINMSTTANQDIRFVQKDSWNNWVNSVIDTVAANPIFRIDKTGFRFAPITLPSAILTYIQTPPESVWAFTLDGDGRPIYDSVNSVGLKWLDKDVMQVLVRSLSYIGINLQAASVEQFANTIKTNGE